ncbi:hypothetical protein MRX96_010564 [Rhipicephalus microplus]
MTIAYQADVSTSTLLGFWKLVARWRGSVYKLIYKEMLVYGAAFTAIAICYRRFLTADQRQLFEQLALYSDRALEHIPLSLAHVVLAYVSGGDENGRLLRRTMMRYANLSLVLVLKSVSGSVKKRFPSTQHLVEAGFMTAAERSLYEATPSRTNRHWLPSVWFVNLANVAVQQGRLLPGPPVKHLLEELNQFRAKCSLLWCYDWVTVPLVYTQVVTLTTHLVLCHFIFFMGWLKVAEQLINPFGEDDDDFETNWLIDRHTQVSYMAEPDLPYTAAAIIHKIPTYRGSAGNIG